MERYVLCMEVSCMEETTILIVEDESLILQDILTLFDWKAAGYKTLTAANGQQGLTLFQKERPRIVMTDVRMPHMDGLAMIRHIRELAPETKFILLTAYQDFDYARTALRLGVTDYLLKKDLSEATIREILEGLKKKPAPDLPEGTDKAELSPIVERAAAYIRGHYSEPDLRIGGVSLACGISASRLSARFRDEMNMTVNEYITFIRLENAKRLLLAGKHKIYEVADMVGYRNQAYFSTLFQEHTGMKPNKYHE